ncbi:peptidoglycan-binding protein [Streptomyces sp. 5-8]|uniref:Peptidoglycan-binding protein n=1 Tax=Streptomyces musisoli TaxID=2802280 RepID=A0ABS1NWJ3_9ACTN|nr:MULTISPECIES: peptidoglycan-binding domain-containing protein [Streptomyces]MBL1104492.1 peptidoglycan-binding protein [Streptomyces musisoli]MBY8840465.1 peptidoglycan-binding protein [Streptomyces sp. SP2-10]
MKRARSLAAVVAVCALASGVGAGTAVAAQTPTGVSAASSGKCGYSGSHPTLSYAPSTYKAAVEHAQCLLLNYHRNAWQGGLSSDGYFGNLTLSAVKQFQSHCGLAKDGIIGPNTWKALHPDTSWC